MTTEKGFATMTVVAIVAVLLVGGGVYYATQSDDSDTSEKTVENQQSRESQDVEQEDTDSLSGTATLKSLFSRNESMRCDVSYSGPENEVSGTLYSAADQLKFRWDFVTTTKSSGDIESHMIRDGDTQYMWSNGMSQGMKMTVDPESLSTNMEAEESIDYNQNVSYECDAWSEDASAFEPPSNIEFQSFGGNSGVGAQMDVQGQAEFDGCSACAQIPAGDSKEQCLASFSCQ